MTTFYIDSDNGSNGNDGLGIGTAWLTLHQYTENARSAGDIAILRRGMTALYDDGGDLTFASSGTIVNPIFMEADYADAFSDHVDLSVTATATLIFGSKTITFASDISSVCAAGDWIYVAAEDAKEFAYEVETVSTVTVTLFLPYKGDQDGAGKTMTNMQSTPIWGTPSASFQVNVNVNTFWTAQGIHFRGTDGNGVVELDSGTGWIFKDCIFEGNGSGDTGIETSDDAVTTIISKCRFFNYAAGMEGNTSGAQLPVYIKDCLFDGNSFSGAKGISCSRWDTYIIEESEFKGNNTGDLEFDNLLATHGKIQGRNLILSSSTQVDRHDGGFDEALMEDFNGVLNDTRQLIGLSTSQGTPAMQSETTKVRSGGGTISQKVTPSTDLATTSEHARLTLFDFPIYATTSSKTYTVYFASDTTTEWTSSPTAAELWVQLEYWGHASNNFRRILKSTGTVDFTTDTDFDQTLTVTVAPSQAGVAYLRVYYCKTKESAKSNIFYIDPKIEIS